MHLTVDRDAFLRALGMVQNIVEPRQTMPILANVLLGAEGGTLSISATDLEVGARVTMQAETKEAGRITISARKLGEIVRELPSAPLSINVQENAWVALKCGGAAYKLVGLGPEDFPSFDVGDKMEWVGLDGKVLKEMLGQTSFAISHDESRYALNGVLLNLDQKEMRIVATDGHRLAMAVRPVQGGKAGLSGIVPRKAVAEVARLTGAGEPVEIGLGGNQFALRMPSVLLMARLIEGTFPNYEQVVPRAHPRRLTAPRGAVIGALRRVSVLSEERTKPVKLTLNPGTLKLAAYHPDFGEAEEQVEVEYAGEELAIGFNSRYLLDALNAHGGDQVVVELKDGLSPGVVRGQEDDGSLCVIMPMRI